MVGWLLGFLAFTFREIVMAVYLAFGDASDFFNYLSTRYQLHKAEENECEVLVGNLNGRDN